MLIVFHDQGAKSLDSDQSCVMMCRRDSVLGLSRGGSGRESGLRVLTLALGTNNPSRYGAQHHEKGRNAAGCKATG